MGIAHNVFCANSPAALAATGTPGGKERAVLLVSAMTRAAALDPFETATSGPGSRPSAGQAGRGVLAPLKAGPGGLLEAARSLLADQVRYHQACEAAYCRSRNYCSAKVAEAFLYP